MNKRSTSIFCTYILIQTLIYAVPFQGGKGLIYTQSADVLNIGHLDFAAGTRYFGKIASFSSDRKAYTLWNVKGYSSLNYGMNRHVELGLSTVFYQDTNRKNEYNIPDNLVLSLKMGSYQSFESHYIFGGRAYVRIPLADEYNLIYEDYSSGTIEVGLAALFSYYSNLAFPEESWSLHSNISYLNHNDVGVNLTDDQDDPSPESMSSDLQFSVGVIYPAGTFDFSFELNAFTFLSQPPVTAYSREYASYLTAGVYYKPYKWITFQAGLDLRFISGEDGTQYKSSERTALIDPPTQDFPNYPGWRGILGMKVAILPRSLYKSEEKVIRNQTRNRREILEKMMQDQEDTKDAEAELSRIKAERKRVEEELERLRKLLEDENQNQ